MAGVYIHIPFCKQACHYCDFHFSTNTTRRTEMVQAISREISLRSNELQGEMVSSIYFGGGTPSLLSGRELELILSSLKASLKISPKAEVTLEANPDDITENLLEEIQTAGINRLSIGIQTFDDVRLKFINRAHSAKEAKDSLLLAKKYFENISADLIYAIPPENMSYWEADLDLMLGYDLSHLSIYGLTVEEKTVFGNWRKKNKLIEVGDKTAARQYELAIQKLKSNVYEHYEVSNFAKPGFRSRHNGSYWKDSSYLGLGPGAHSYDRVFRSYNVSNNAKYLKALDQDVLPIAREKLSSTERINEYLMVRMRTIEGIDLGDFRERFHRDLMADRYELIYTFIEQDYLVAQDENLSLTSKGLMIADELSMRLFYEE